MNTFHQEVKNTVQLLRAEPTNIKFYIDGDGPYIIPKSKVEQTLPKILTSFKGTTIEYNWEHQDAVEVLLHYITTGSLPHFTPQNAADAESHQHLLVRSWILGGDEGLEKFQDVVMGELLKSISLYPCAKSILDGIISMYTYGALHQLMVEELVLRLCARGEENWSVVEDFKDGMGFLGAFTEALREFDEDEKVWEERWREEKRKRYMVGDEGGDGEEAE